ESAAALSPAIAGCTMCDRFRSRRCSHYHLRLCVLFGDEIERGAGRNQLLFLGALLKIPDDALGMLHHPPANVALVDGITLLRVFLQMRDAGKSQRQFRIVEMLLPLEVDLEVLPLHGVQFVLQPDDAGLAIGGFLLAEEERALVDTVYQPVGGSLAAC